MEYANPYDEWCDELTIILNETRLRNKILYDILHNNTIDEFPEYLYDFFKDYRSKKDYLLVTVMSFYIIKGKQVIIDMHNISNIQHVEYVSANVNYHCKLLWDDLCMCVKIIQNLYIKYNDTPMWNIYTIYREIETVCYTCSSKTNNLINAIRLLDKYKHTDNIDSILNDKYITEGYSNQVYLLYNTKINDLVDKIQLYSIYVEIKKISSNKVAILWNALSTMFRLKTLLSEKYCCIIYEVLCTVIIEKNAYAAQFNSVGFNQLFYYNNYVD